MSLASAVPPARITWHALKVGLFGGPGSGKSSFASTAPGPRGYIDPENSNGFYVTPHTGECPLALDVIAPDAVCNGCGGDYHIATLDLNRIEKAVLAAHADNGRSVKSWIIDPIKLIQDQLVDDKGFIEVKPEYSDWGKIKRPMHRWIRKLLDTQANMVLVSRESETEAGRAGGKLEVVKTSKPDAWKETPHDVDIMIQCVVENTGTPRKPDPQWIFTVTKSRLKAFGLPTGKFWIGTQDQPIVWDTVFGSVVPPEGARQSRYDTPGAAGQNGAFAAGEVEARVDEICAALADAGKRGDAAAHLAAWRTFADARGEFTEAQAAIVTAAKDASKPGAGNGAAANGGGR